MMFSHGSREQEDLETCFLCLRLQIMINQYVVEHKASLIQYSVTQFTQKKGKILPSLFSYRILPKYCHVEKYSLAAI